MWRVDPQEARRRLDERAAAAAAERAKAEELPADRKLAFPGGFVMLAVAGYWLWTSTRSLLDDQWAVGLTGLAGTLALLQLGVAFIRFSFSGKRPRRRYLALSTLVLVLLVPVQVLLVTV